MAKYSFVLKMKVVTEYLSRSASLRMLEKKYGISDHYAILKWLNAYEILGADGLKRSRTSQVYSVEFKVKAITMYEASERTYQDIANELGLNNPSLIRRWRQVYLEEGISGLSRSSGRLLMKDKPAKQDKINVNQQATVNQVQHLLREIQSHRKAPGFTNFGRTQRYEDIGEVQQEQSLNFSSHRVNSLSLFFTRSMTLA